MSPLVETGPATWTASVNANGTVHVRVYNNATLEPLFSMNLTPDDADHLAYGLTTTATAARDLRG